MKIKQLLFPCLMSVIVLASCREDKIAEQYQSINSSNKTEETVEQEEKEYEFPDYFLGWQETSRNVVDRINSGEEVPLDELNDAHIKSIAAQFLLEDVSKGFYPPEDAEKVYLYLGKFSLWCENAKDSELLEAEYDIEDESDGLEYYNNPRWKLINNEQTKRRHKEHIELIRGLENDKRY